MKLGVIYKIAFTPITRQLIKQYFMHNSRKELIEKINHGHWWEKKAVPTVKNRSERLNTLHQIFIKDV